MNEWQTKKLGEICRLIKGRKPKKFVSKSNIPYLTAKVIRGSVLPKFVGEDCPSSVLVKENQIIIIMDGSNSGEIFTGLNGALASTMGIIEFSNDLLIPQYLLHFLNIHRERFTKSRTGSAIPHLSKEEFENLEIPLLTLPEQKRLAALLDELFEKLEKAKENAEKNLKNSRELFEKYLDSIISDPQKDWKHLKLSDVITHVEYGSSKKSHKEGKVPVLGMGNIQNGRFEWDRLKYTNNEPEIKKYSLKYNDVLFNRTNSPELVGKTAIYKGEMPSIFAGYLIRIHRNEDLLDGDYLNYYLNSSFAINYGRSVMTSSVNQANINGSKLKNYPIVVPPLKEQQNIVNKLNDLSIQTKKLESIYKQKLAKLDELKQSILHQAFTDKL